MPLSGQAIFGAVHQSEFFNKIGDRPPIGEEAGNGRSGSTTPAVTSAAGRALMAQAGLSGPRLALEVLGLELRGSALGQPDRVVTACRVVDRVGADIETAI